MYTKPQKILDFPLKWQRIIFLEAANNKLPIILKNLQIILKMLTLLQHLSRILKRIKQKLQPLTSIRIFPLP